MHAIPRRGIAAAIAAGFVAAALVGGAGNAQAASTSPVRVYASSVTELSADQFVYTSVAAAIRPGTSATLTAATSSFTPSSSAQPDVTGSWTNCIEDGSISVENCLQLDYSTYVCTGSTYCGAINNIHLTYYNLDPHDASLVHRRWVEGASGRCHQGCSGYLSGTVDSGYQPVASGTTYNYAGHWANQYSELAAGAGEQRGGTSTLYWSYRGSNETLTNNCVLNDDGSGGSER
jgi:hypothetical protein